METITVDNYLEHANEDFNERLKEVYNENIKYVASDMSLLATTLERLYKAVIEGEMKTNPNFNIPSGKLLGIGHNLQQLALIIEEQTGLNLFNVNSKEDYRERRNFLFSLRKDYEEAIYTKTPEFDKFKEAYKIVEIQKEKIEEYIKSKNIDLDKISDDMEKEDVENELS